MIRVGIVQGIADPADGERIQVRVPTINKYEKDSKLLYAFPLLPKMLHIKPKIGEAVFIINADDEAPNGQKYYIGPIISQPHKMYDEIAESATALLDGGAKIEEEAPQNVEKTIGAFAKDDEIAVYGRKNSDIILSDNDIRIRCGVRLSNEIKKDEIGFNRGAPAFIKLKYYPTPLDSNQNKIYDSITDEILSDEYGEHTTTFSTATIVADKINLLSPNGDPYVNISDRNENISDEEMQNIIETAHQLPYGDKLVHFLTLLLKMFKSHTHKYDNLPPCPDTESLKFDLEFGMTEEEYKDKLLSKDVRIN